MPNIIAGHCCEYTAFDCDHIICCCKRKSECLCCVHECCLDFEEPSLGCGCTTNKDNNECCKISCNTCSYGLKLPDKLCAVACQMLCCRSVQSCPFDDQYLEGCICAYCGIQCAPECSCCGSAGTNCPSLDRPIKDYSSAPSGEKIKR